MDEREAHKQRLMNLFAEAEHLPVAEQKRFVEHTTQDDPNLRQELLSLLKCAGGTDFLGATQQRELDDMLLALARLEGERPMAPGTQFGRYRILSVLGKGGMGVVYEAEQDHPRRRVALKVVRGALSSEEVLKRFDSEADILGSLNHPSIARIWDAGTAQGETTLLPFFAMELVRGETLDEYVKTRPGFQERMVLLERIALAVKHAHEKGIVHRDLKPGNIMVDADGLPKLLDFGVARATGADFSSLVQTAVGAVIGTVQYMSPEQAAGLSGDVDTSTDVYSLGVIAYELFARRLPYELKGLTLAQAMRVVREDVPPLLGTIDGNFRGDLEAIIAKALQKEPALRYANAGELAADLRGYLDGGKINARPVSVIGLLRRRARRAPRAVGLSLLAGAIMLCTAAWVAYDWQQRRQIDAVKAELDNALTESIPDREEFQKLHALITRLTALSPHDGGLAHKRLCTALTGALHSVLAGARLDPKQIEKVELGLELLKSVNAVDAAAVRAEFEQRLRAWQSVFELAAPFERLEQVFDRGAVTIAADGLAAAAPSNPGQSEAAFINTRVHASGEYRMEAQFVRWAAAPHLGLGLRGSRGEGYTAVLRPNAAPEFKFGDESGEDKPPATLGESVVAQGSVTLQIQRNGAVLRQYQIPLAQEPRQPLLLRMTVAEKRIDVQIGTGGAAAFNDPFPLAARQDALIAVALPAESSLAALKTFRRADRAKASPLELGDELFAQEKFEDALASYERQSNDSASPDYVQEARYKRGLCLLKLRRMLDSATAFEALSSEPGSRWPALAACQLWAIRTDARDFKAADALMEYIDAKFTFEQLAPQLPEDLVRKVVAGYTYGLAGMQLIFPDKERLAKHLRMKKVADLLVTDRDIKLWARWTLARGYFWEGFPEEAEKLVQKICDDNFSYFPMRLACHEEYCWLLHLRGVPEEGVKWVERFTAADHSNEDQQLLCALARLHYACGRAKEAEELLDRLLKSHTAEEFHYRVWASTHLMKGFIALDRGDKAGAEASWTQATLDHWKKARAPKISGSGGNLGNTYALVAAGICGKKLESSAQLLADIFPAKGSSTDALIVYARDNANLTPENIQRAWSTPRAMACARNIAFQNLSLRDMFESVAAVQGSQVMVSAIKHPLTPDEERALDSVMRKLVHSFTSGDFSMPQLFQLGMTFKGFTNVMGWAGVADAVPREDRVPLAYFMGHVVDGRGDSNGAVGMWEAALKDATDEDAAKKLLQTELQRRKK